MLGELRRLRPVIEPRIYRAAFVPALLAVVLTMFSFESRPGPLEQGLPADVLFDGNQAADLARHLDLPVVAALRRVRSTATQTGLPAAQRHRNVRDAFAATRAARSVQGGIVLLVDDVCTTGATLEACARELKRAGVAEVRALTAARVVGRSQP